MDNLKKLSEASKEEVLKKEAQISKKELRRLTEVLQDADMSNTKKKQSGKDNF